MLDRQAEIISILEAHGIRYRVYRHDIMVSCPFHQHSGRKLKLGIHVSGRMIHCWVCGKSGTWNTYAAKMGLPKLDLDRLPQKTTPVHFARSPDPRLPKSIYPLDTDWPRQGEPPLPLQVLRHLPGVYKYWDARGQVFRLLVAVTDGQGDLLGWTAIAPPGHRPKSLSSPGKWASLALWPWPDPRGVVIVEGVADAVRVMQAGFAATACFGTSNWNADKAALLCQQLDDHARVVLAFDGDQAGRKAAARALHDLVPALGADRVAVLRLPDGADPASTDIRRLSRALRKLRAVEIQLPAGSDA